jgi:hypothetical protein
MKVIPKKTRSKKFTQSFTGVKGFIETKDSHQDCVHLVALMTLG